MDDAIPSSSLFFKGEVVRVKLPSPKAANGGRMYLSTGRDDMAQKQSHPTRKGPLMSILHDTSQWNLTNRQSHGAQLTVL